MYNTKTIRHILCESSYNVSKNCYKYYTNYTNMCSCIPFLYLVYFTSDIMQMILIDSEMFTSY
jgi:hypothetical protein